MAAHFHTEFFSQYKVLANIFYGCMIITIQKKQRREEYFLTYSMRDAADGASSDK